MYGSHIVWCLGNLTQLASGHFWLASAAGYHARIQPREAAQKIHVFLSRTVADGDDKTA